MRRVLFTSLVGLALAAPTISAAPRTTDPSTIVLMPPTSAPTSSVWPRLGDPVGFAVTYPKTLSHYSVRVQVACYQNGNLVYADAMPYTYTFTLGGSASQWTINGGSASCVADLYYWGNGNGPNFNWLATTGFNAAG